ncbi:MAG: cytochrome c/c1 heme-lyase [Monoraphidium minutum]|nr:MAG: cytochrome c/c1 heme-lyase [Monoraphidium minutum]
MPVVPNAAAAGQAGALSAARAASSIPIADPSAVPAHQQGVAGSSGGEQAVWMYPSEQQFYNAMARKGWEPSEGDMPAVVAIHNAVNERAWAHVQSWEALHACDCPESKLLRFRGRPADYSPKARLLNLLGYKLPFDRHDWVVDRCGTEVRYVIDFYSGAPSAGVTASMHLDVRPALDSFGAAADRLRMQWRWAASGRWRDP